jgi:uncharacterized protein with ParB-like and HNH nuclease domain
MEALLNRNENFADLAQKNNRVIASGILTVEKVVSCNLHFNIPIYQRLYVWKVNQIRTLLEDIKNSFEKNKDYDFFLGGVMLSNNSSNQIDLVDGQQRFTTLWLICDFLSSIEPILKSFTYTANNEPRIFFSIRDKAQLFLKDKSSFNEFINENGQILKGVENEVSEIIPLVEGQQLIKEILTEFQKDKDFNIALFSKFIFNKINLTYTFIPGKSDMNRVFEAMNNRGKQLEHHELLKSRMLKKIDSNERLAYSLIWDACSNMNVYIEKSIKDVANLSWKNLYGDVSIVYEDDTISDSKIELENIDIIKLLKENQADEKEEMSLKSILDNQEKIASDTINKNLNESDYLSKSVRSIINFPTFLLHVLRVYQLKKNYDINNAAEVIEKKLLTAFDISSNFDSSDNIKDFIILLWKSRIYFDKYVIKWVNSSEEKEEFHEIEGIQISKSIIKNKDGSTNDTISVQRVEVSDENIKCLVLVGNTEIVPLVDKLSSIIEENKNEINTRGFTGFNSYENNPTDFIADLDLKIINKQYIHTTSVQKKGLAHISKIISENIGLFEVNSQAFNILSNIKTIIENSKYIKNFNYRNRKYLDVFSKVLKYNLMDINGINSFNSMFFKYILKEIRNFIVDFKEGNTSAIHFSTYYSRHSSTIICNLMSINKFI